MRYSGCLLNGLIIKWMSMKRILIILPQNNYVGTSIMEGFANGFELNKYRVMTKVIDELTLDDVKEFRPDMIFGYDYSFLTDENCTKIIKQSGCKNLIFYFADEPKSKFALGKRDELYEELKKLNPRVFIWDKDFLDEFEDTTYLPLAVNPKKYATKSYDYQYAITFVVNSFTDSCQEILCELIKAFKNKLCIFSSEKHFLQSIEEIKEKKLLDEEDLEIYSKCWKGFVESEEELAEIFSTSKINLNINLQGKSSINYRVFEVLASGGFLLTDEREDLSEYFEIGKHLETYKDIKDLIDKIDFYLKNITIAQKIAQLGKFEVISNHNFSARARMILKKSA